MKKVVFVIESLRCGGAEKSLVTLLNNLDYSKLKVDLILFNEGGEFEKMVPEQVNLINKKLFRNIGFVIKLVGKINFFILRKFGKKKHNAQHFWDVFKRLFDKHSRNYDIAIAYNQGFATYYVADKIEASKKIAWVNTDYQKAGYNALSDIDIYKNYDSIVAVSEESKASFLAAFNKLLLKVDVIVIQDILDDESIKKMADLPLLSPTFNPKLVNILTVGRLVEAKGYPLAIDACKILINMGYQINWCVIGEGKERGNLEALIKENKLEGSFNLLGFKENPYVYMKACDIYVQSSLFEGFGLSLFEALILNKPIVTSNFSTASTIISHNETGLICEMNSEAIANNIKYFIDNPDFKNKIIDNLLIKDSGNNKNTLEQFYQLINI